MRRLSFTLLLTLIAAPFLQSCDFREISGERHVDSCLKKVDYELAVCLLEAGYDQAAIALLKDLAANGDLNSKRLIAGSYIGSENAELDRLARSYASELERNGEAATR